MDRKSLEKMVEKIMSKLKEDSEEDPDSDFVHDDSQPSTSTGKGSTNKRNLKRLQKKQPKKGALVNHLLMKLKRDENFSTKKNEKHGFVKSFRCLHKISKDIQVDKDKVTVKKKIERDIEINEDFTDIEDEQDLDDVFLETCVICEEVMPMDVLEKHARKCRGKKTDRIGQRLCLPENIEAENGYFFEQAAVLDQCGLLRIIFD
ncbi:hypothetical protein DAPPUDRAFT_322638 [Daphnia pulex]|uniref:UBZ4-type domain-containing protein n=1 Tax=Daphnia pulex TaxID=6669 RepID=E9GWK8_DAPPU|nr:hypothetical protein DAPPUDRAFT_322638 [Daphnia pulex]|eukprot:EFX76170.1 hypothetical protein DAPPUDRAFT_322638 [Daphnia pulex]